MRKIAIASFKGGTGKTTSAVNLAFGLSVTGLKVLLIDGDGSRNATSHIGGEAKDTLFDLLTNEVFKPQEVRKNLFLIPGDQRLWRIDGYLFQYPDPNRIFQDRIPSSPQWDYIIIDTSPTGNRLNYSVISYADELLVPVEMSFLSLIGVVDVVRAIKSIGQDVKYILPTKYDQRTNEAGLVLKALINQFDGKVSAPIKIDVKLTEAPKHHLSIFEYAPRSRGAHDYLELVRKVKNG